MQGGKKKYQAEKHCYLPRMIGSVSQQNKQLWENFSSLLIWRHSHNRAQATGSCAIQRLWAPYSISPILATSEGEKEEAQFGLFSEKEKKKSHSSRTRIRNLLVCNALKLVFYSRLLCLSCREDSPRKAPFLLHLPRLQWGRLEWMH